jgi:retinol dehydrogenase 12
MTNEQSKKRPMHAVDRTDAKVAIVTGANGGIGFATADGLAKTGYSVVLACRDVVKAEEARALIAAESPNVEVVSMKLDLGSGASIHAFVDAFEARFARLDVLVNNAALVPSSRTVTADGLETQFGVNHLGPFILTRLLVPILKRSAPSRIVVVSSSVHKGAKIPFDDLQAEKGYSTMRIYGATKLMNLLFVQSLEQRLQGTGVTVNAVHPGVVSTALARDFPAPFRLMAKLFFSTPEKGARTSVFVATSPTLATTSGKYFASSKETATDKNASDAEAAERLWIISSKLASLPTWRIGDAPPETRPAHA